MRAPQPTLPDPVVEGAMVFGAHTPASLGVGTPLFFTNPASELAREDITLKMSVDGGAAWTTVHEVQVNRKDFAILHCIQEFYQSVPAVISDLCAPSRKAAACTRPCFNSRTAPSACSGTTRTTARFRTQG